MADIILIPGLWLDGDSWGSVSPRLEAAGHRPIPVTLPGMQSRSDDRSKVTLADLVQTVVEIIDRCSPEAEVVVVGHSAGCGLGHAAVDARPDRVSRAIYIGGFPTGHGLPLAGGFTVEDGEIRLPAWSEFDGADLGGLDTDALETFRRRAVPSPGAITTETQELHDERRYLVPVTVISTEFTSDMLRGWVEQEMEPVIEFNRLERVEYIDLPTGHWPQFTRPDDLADIILRTIDGAE